MADISKISPDGGTTEYNIKDATARTDVSTINGKIPSGASSSNKMATASDVDAKISWADAGKSVKKNYAQVLKTVPNGSQSTLSNLTIKGFTVSASSGAYASSKTPLDNLENGKEYIATVNVTANTGNGTRISVRDSGDTIKKSTEITGTGKFLLKFTYETGWYLSVFATWSTAATGSITVDEVMIRPASILDDTYAEPIPDNTELFPRSEQAVLGAKNLAPLEYDGYSNNLDVTLTVNSDMSITLNGTQGANGGQYYLSRRQTYKYRLNAGSYKVSGAIANKVTLAFYKNKVTGDASQGFDEIGIDSGNGLEFSLSQLSDIQIQANIAGNATFNNETIYPLITVGTDNDRTWTSPAMTNKELTDSLAVKTLVPTLESTDFTFTADTKVLVSGNVVSVNFAITGGSLPINTTKKIMTLPAGYKPSYLMHGVAYVKDASTPAIRIFVDSSRQVSLLSPLAAVENKDIFGSITFINS